MTFEDTLNEAVKAYTALLATVEDLTKLPTDFEQRVNEIFAQQLQARQIKVHHPGNQEGGIPLALEMAVPAPNLYYVVTESEGLIGREETLTYQAKEGATQIPTNRNGYITLSVVPKKGAKVIYKIVIDFAPSLKIPEQDYALVTRTSPNYKQKVEVWAVRDNGEVAYALHQSEYGTMCGILDDKTIIFSSNTGNKSSDSRSRIDIDLSLSGYSKIHRISIELGCLGNGLLTKFFKHMQYEGLDLLAR